VLGCDVAGTVEAVGTNVTGLEASDEVFGYPFPECGAFAEYVPVPAAKLAPKPASLSFEQAAAIPLAGTTPPSACRRVLTPKGTLVLISGDSPGRRIGPVGRIVRALALSPFVSQKLTPLNAKPRRQDLETLGRLAGEGGWRRSSTARMHWPTCPRRSATWKRDTPAARS
jgi:NADPH:quinone reductase-like Zn-dependent oxidoreductase